MRGTPVVEPQMDDGSRILLISPVRNEATHLEEVVSGVALQQRLPDTWVVVDDGSTDGTAELLDALLAPLPFARLVRTPPDFTRDDGDRNAAGGPDRAWNFGLAQADVAGYTHIGKLDGDIVLPPDYLRALLDRFAAEPALGMAAGAVTELRDGRWWRMPTPDDHVTAPARIYSRECLEAIGGMPAYMGADVVTTFYAKMRGFRTRTFRDLPVRHLRAMGSADGLRRGRERQGAYQYVVHYTPVWVVLRSLVVAARFRPYGLSGLWFLIGYAKAAIRRMPRVEDPEWRAFARAEQRRKLHRAALRATRYAAGR
jgi:poly-beta-1,6-N-acetyl-D-glucosamine synthase